MGWRDLHMMTNKPFSQIMFLNKKNTTSRDESCCEIANMTPSGIEQRRQTKNGFSPLTHLNFISCIL